MWNFIKSLIIDIYDSSFYEKLIKIDLQSFTFLNDNFSETKFTRLSIPPEMPDAYLTKRPIYVHERSRIRSESKFSSNETTQFF